MSDTTSSHYSSSAMSMANHHSSTLVNQISHSSAVMSQANRHPYTVVTSGKQLDIGNVLGLPPELLPESADSLIWATSGHFQLRLLALANSILGPEWHESDAFAYYHDRLYEVNRARQTALADDCQPLVCELLQDDCPTGRYVFVHPLELVQFAG